MKRIPIIILISLLILTACGAPAARSIADSAPQSAGGGGAVAPMAPLPAQEAVSNSPQGVPASQAQQRIVLQTADLAIVVKDPQAKMEEIGAMAQRLGGFVVSSNMGQTYISSGLKVPEGTIVIRVPATDLDSALGQIKANTIEVQNENRSGQDVTDQYVDLKSQLKAKQAAADKLYEIMQKTEKAEDTLMVFNQLTQVQSEIEVLKGQINYFDQASTLSSISVRLIAEETIQPIEIAGWQPQGVARDAVQALVNFFQNFVDFLIWLVLFILPVAVIIILLLAMLWRLLRWFWRKVFPRKTPPSAVPPAPAE